MKKSELLKSIAEKDFDLNTFGKLAFNDHITRDRVVHHMITNPDIMVYYHYHYTISKASQKNPDLFYDYWNAIAELLNHPNSYHRSFVLTILGNLAKVDSEDRFITIEDAYFGLIDDEKFMTGNLHA